jgi:hypothetical protein
MAMATMLLRVRMLPIDMLPTDGVRTPLRLLRPNRSERLTDFASDDLSAAGSRPDIAAPVASSAACSRATNAVSSTSAASRANGTDAGARQRTAGGCSSASRADPGRATGSSSRAAERTRQGTGEGNNSGRHLQRTPEDGPEGAA